MRCNIYQLINIMSNAQFSLLLYIFGEKKTCFEENDI
jgi:hypothetical protein